MAWRSEGAPPAAASDLQAGRRLTLAWVAPVAGPAPILGSARCWVSPRRPREAGSPPH